MSDIAIRVENLGKLYRVGKRESYRTLRDTLAYYLGAPLRLLGSRRQRKSENPDAGWVWALRGLGFEVKRGEAVGVIGANGAGKSTLLKILSRVTEPTEGTATLRGRVGSLLLREPRHLR